MLPGNARPLGPESLDSARDPELVEGLVAEGLQPGISSIATLERGDPREIVRHVNGYDLLLEGEAPTSPKAT